MSNEIQYISRDDFILKYHIKGKGPYAFIIGSHIYYPRVFSSSLEDNFQLVYMDHRGFASKSSKVVEEDFQIEKLLQDIECLRLKLKQDKITLIGHSIHALMALEYAKKYPKNVDKLILSAASPIAGEKLFLEANKYFEESVDPYRKKIFADNMSTIAQATQQNPEEAFVIRMLKFGPMLWYDPSYDATNLWKDVKLNPLGSEIIWNKLFTGYEIPDIKHTNIPVLLLLGRYDYFNPPHLWENHRAKFKDLTVRIFEKSGHTPSFEEAEVFNSELLRWTNNLGDFMRKKKIQLNTILLLTTVLLAACNHSTDKNTNQFLPQQDKAWKIGAKIHFEEESGHHYIGLKEINALTKSALKSVLHFAQESGDNNAKILLKRENGNIIIDHYTERSRPNVGEELHATLLYTSPRGFHSSETLAQVCNVLFKNCDVPPDTQTVSSKYNAIIKQSWRFKISEIVVTKNDKGPSFIMAKLLFNNRENIYLGDKPISAGLHMTLVNCKDSSILEDPVVVDKLTKKLNEDLKGKFIKISAKNGVADLEFGMSGQPWRIRAGQKIEFKK